MNPLGGKDENSKHIQGIKGKPIYLCPKCGKGMSVKERKFLIVCGKCNAVVKGDDLIKNK